MDEQGHSYVIWNWRIFTLVLPLERFYGCFGIRGLNCRLSGLFMKGCMVMGALQRYLDLTASETVSKSVKIELELSEAKHIRTGEQSSHALLPLGRCSLSDV